MNVKADIVLIFVIMLLLILAVYYVGTVSEVLSLAKVGQQLGYFLTGRNSAGNFGTASTPG